MKTIIIYGHTNPEQSNANKALLNLANKDNIDVLTLIEKYPDGNFDIAKEQDRLLKYDQIILQFPFYWYNAPYIMKKYVDDIFIAGYAFKGALPGELKNKILKIAITAGASHASYVPGGYNNEHPTTFLKPFAQMADKMGMMYKPAFIAYDSMDPLMATDQAIVDEYVTFITK